MRAALLDAVDAPFRVAEVAKPEPDASQVLVKVQASAVNPLDLKIRAGAASHARQPLPAILGIDMAGMVEAVGADVADFRPGDEVYGMTGGVGGIPGSLAEYVAVDPALLARKPASLSMRQAAALPLAAITAWEGLVDRAALKPGQHVLVLGVGAVGHAAMQIAQALGAEVSANEGENADIVFDTIGGVSLDKAFLAVKRFGHVVSALGWGTHALAPLSFKAASYSGIFTLAPLLDGVGRAHHGEILRHAARLADACKLTPRVDDRVFGLGDVGAAYDLLGKRQANGKLVITIPKL